ncbi:ribosomal RNA small subunit methyltransferase H [Olea europaea subsp. europaea]|nr:ribosomal RNA small subunit methyltransferase H [Olea europaea subsp. europaea]
MASAAIASAKSLIRTRLFLHSNSPPKLSPFCFSISTTTAALTNKNKDAKIRKKKQKWNSEANLLVKRRTRSDKELDEESFLKHYGNGDSVHVPVMLGEVLDVFASVRLESFVDCTLGAGGHSSAIIKAHPEMKLYVGLDVDPVAHEMAQSRLKGILYKDSCDGTSDLQVHTFLKNFKNIKSVLHDIDGEVSAAGVHGIIMDLGMSSMQVGDSERGFSVLNDGPLDMRMNPEASLKAEDILNSWPDSEVGRILRDYGEESNWYSLQNKIVKARLTGGLHSTRELVDLIRNSTSWTRGGRQGWIKTATRVFQALRIAVNDELNTLKDSIRACFDSLSSGGRLAVISFHSLEDRIVKRAFLNIVNCSEDDSINIKTFGSDKEAWIKQIVQGRDATILTKRPISPSEQEEKLNTRSRSAKLRVIQKI